MLLLPTTRQVKEGWRGGKGGLLFFLFLFFLPDRRRDAFYACEPAVRVRTLDSLHAAVRERTSGLGWVWGGQTVTPTDRVAPVEGERWLWWGANILPAWPLGRAVCPRFSASLMRLIGSESRRKARLNCIPFITRPHKSAIICIRLHIRLRSG